MESMRKDVECTFGMLKKRFGTLQSGVRVKKVLKVDQIWKTCCALHNLRLELNGFDKDDWIGISENHSEVFSIHRLQQFGSDVVNQNITPEELDECSDENGVRFLYKMSYDLFQACLIQHFNIRFKKHDIKWPRHCKAKVIDD